MTVPESFKKDYRNMDLKPYAKVLLNQDKVYPLHQRFRALFALKAVKTEECIDILNQAFQDDSVLLKHEIAYVMGQIKSEYAIPYLVKVLENLSEDPMVRHEAAEALGAIGDPSALPVLQKYSQDEQRAVKETCDIAIDRIKYEQSLQNDLKGHHQSQSGYTSIDPAPALNESRSTEELGNILMNTSLPLFERYRAMFSLRNRGDEFSVLTLAKGFEDESALFRHEIAYVFGQMQHPASVPSLSKVLSNVSEDAMVRHEAAEAIGSIATPECMQILEQFANEQKEALVVKESCQVGMDMFEFENSGEFQYAGIESS